MHLPSPKHMCTCTSRGAPDTAGDNQNAVVRGGTNKLRRTVRRVLMPVPRLVVQEWVSPAHWQPHLGASRAPWTPEPRAQKEVSNENGSVLRPRDAGPTSPGPLYIRYCCLHSYFHLSDATAIYIYMK